jgi:hypothetical protein
MVKYIWINIMQDFFLLTLTTPSSYTFLLFARTQIRLVENELIRTSAVVMSFQIVNLFFQIRRETILLLTYMITCLGRFSYFSVYKKAKKLNIDIANFWLGTYWNTHGKKMLFLIYEHIFIDDALYFHTIFCI